MKYLFTALLCLTFTAAYAASNGKWQMTITTTEEGEHPSEVKMTQCMSAEQIKAQAGMVEQEDATYESDDGDCHVKMETKGNTSTMESVCKNGETTKMISTSTGESISSTTTTTVDGKTSVMTMEGKRLGDC